MSLIHWRTCLEQKKSGLKIDNKFKRDNHQLSNFGFNAHRKLVIIYCILDNNCLYLGAGFF